MLLYLITEWLIWNALAITVPCRLGKNLHYPVHVPTIYYVTNYTPDYTTLDAVSMY